MINMTTGEMFTTQILDRENKSQYTFKIIAKDQGYPVLTSEATVTVSVLDVNDHTPQFDQSQYTANIIQRSPVGAVVMLATATDLDWGDNGSVTFTMQSTNGTDRYFKIDPRNGLIQVAGVIDVAQLTREGIFEPGSSQSVLTLTLYASDNGKPQKRGQANLSIHIESYQSDGLLTFDNYTYYLTIEEGLRPGRYKNTYSFIIKMYLQHNIVETCTATLMCPISFIWIEFLLKFDLF